jgi:hypothetical protein
VITIRSYLCDRFQEGTGEPGVLLNPATEEPLAGTSTAGLDLAAAVRHGREVGGPELRGMTFGERAALLTRMAKALHERREELLDLAIANGGNTRSDAKFDVDGATGTLAAYGRLGEPLGDRRVLVDGEGVALGRSSRFYGMHLLTPREGVAVLINAYNFPAWGFAEKAACALLAGMPRPLQAGHQHGARHRADGRGPRRGRPPAGRRDPARRGAGRRPARSPRTAGRRRLHRFGGDGARDPVEGEPAAELRPGQRRGRLAQRRRPRPRRRGRVRHLRPVPEGRGSRADAEGRSEVHRGAPRPGAGGPRRRGPGGASRAARRARRRRSGRPGRPDGAARHAEPARGRPRGDRGARGRGPGRPRRTRRPWRLAGSRPGRASSSPRP